MKRTQRPFDDVAAAVVVVFVRRSSFVVRSLAFEFFCRSSFVASLFVASLFGGEMRRVGVVVRSFVRSFVPMMVVVVVVVVVLKKVCL